MALLNTHVSLSNMTNLDPSQESKIFEICISPKSLGRAGREHKENSSSIPSVISLFLDKFQRSFVQDRQLRASKHKDENKDDKEEEGDT